MHLTRAEKERLLDSRLKIQSVTKALQHIEPGKLRDFEEIRQCLESADRSIGGVLRSSGPDRRD